MPLLYEAKLSDPDLSVLKRLIYEINGYDVLIRTFSIADAEFDLDEKKWRELLAVRSHLWQMKEEIIAKLCRKENKPFTGEYHVNLEDGTLHWG